MSVGALAAWTPRSGRIVQHGTYDELLSDADGLFASLANQQLT